MRRTIGGRLLHQSRHDAPPSAPNSRGRSYEMSLSDDLNASVNILFYHCRFAPESPCLSMSFAQDLSQPQPSVLRNPGHFTMCKRRSRMHWDRRKRLG